jgi:prophage tail gpP-like protein
LSTSYSVVAGDTFALIARKEYGDENAAYRIKIANPGVAEPLTAGTTLTVPSLPGAPTDVPQTAPSESIDEVAIEINGRRFRFWGEVRITRATDNLDTVEFSAPFEPDRADFREAFRPFSYVPLTVTVGGVPLFTGTMVGVDPAVTPDSNTVSVSGYATPGVLADCTAPASAYPIEFNDVALPDIAAALAAPFGVKVVFEADAGAPFERVALAPGTSVLSFLNELTKQRNLVMSSTTDGALRFWQSAAPSIPVANLAVGESPLISASPFFNPQDYYSHITGLEQVAVGYYGSQFTVQNARLAGVLRPTSFKTTDTAAGDVKTTVDAKIGRMFGNAVSYSLAVAGWRDPQGDLWAPNTLVTLLAPRVMVYAPYTFEIRSVQFSATGNERTATLDVVLPGAFSGRIPGAMPWDE